MSLTNDHYQNVVTLLQQCIRLRKKYKECQNQLDQMINKYSIEDIEEEEKIKEELDFLSKYETNLLDQATVIMNEHNLSNLPSLEELEHTSS